MKSAIKSQWLLVLSSLFIVASSLLSAQSVSARCDAIEICGPLVPGVTTRPYFKELGGDVFAGGWFEDASGSCSTTGNYQSPNNPVGPTPSLTGGIQTFAKVSSGNSAGGSSTHYGAFSLGQIEGDLGNKGHYSAAAAAATSSTANNLLSFGNYAAAGTWGGLFEGATPQSHCIPDYYDLKKPASTTSLNNSDFDGRTFSGKKDYLANIGAGSLFTLNNDGASPAVIDTGSVITVFVPGSVYIGANIINNVGTVDNVPKFALVAQGSIYIGPNVTRLDGWYIAQPSAPSSASAVSDDSGVIWTCHPANLDPVLDTYPSTSCGKSLLVNGALTAKEIKFLRVSGDVASPLATTIPEDSLNNALASDNISEIINYTPMMVIGGQFFNQNVNPTSTTSYKLESLRNLPPIF